MSKNYFEKLASINVNDHIEVKKTGGVNLKYLSWAFAQEQLALHHPDAIITVKTFGELELPYLKTDIGYFVQVLIEINGVVRGRPFPVTDHANNPLGAEYVKFEKQNGKTIQKVVRNRDANAFDINTSIQRAFVKSCAEHGLGLYIYSGEDLPRVDVSAEEEKIEEVKAMIKEVADKRQVKERSIETMLKTKINFNSLDELKEGQADQLLVLLDMMKNKKG